MTMSLCEVCYKHIPAIVFERDNSIWIKKQCPTHGKTEHMIERSAEFYGRIFDLETGDLLMWHADEEHIIYSNTANQNKIVRVCLPFMVL